MIWASLTGLFLTRMENGCADSQRRPDGSDYKVSGENVGCPASREEVNHFLKVLAKTSTLDADQLSLI